MIYHVLVLKFMKTILIGSDHAGFLYKEFLKKELESMFEYKDFGTFSESSMDYPDVVHPLCQALENDQFGILVCGSGNGVCMTANKYPNVRAALVWNQELAALARQHNNANIICIPARFISENEALECVKTFLSTDFEGGRHQNRVNKINI